MIRRTRVAGLSLALFLAAAACQQEDAQAPVDAESAQAATASATGGAAATRDWTTVVAATPEGGFLMGNPDAPVKLVEYGSLTCSHCADFAANAAPALRQNYVRTGKVSFEFRNFVRDPIDFTGALLTRCSGARPFFKLTDQVMADQAGIFERVQTAGEAEQRRIAGLPEVQQFAGWAKLTGLDRFVAARGVPSARANQCLADKAASAKLLAIRQDATDRLQIQGTPTFLINGKVVPNAAAWDALEPQLKAAIG